MGWIIVFFLGGESHGFHREQRRGGGNSVNAKKV